MEGQADNRAISKREAAGRAFASEDEMAAALSWAVIDLPGIDAEFIADIYEAWGFVEHAAALRAEWSDAV